MQVKPLIMYLILLYNTKGSKLELIYNACMVLIIIIIETKNLTHDGTYEAKPGHAEVNVTVSPCKAAAVLAVPRSADLPTVQPSPSSQGSVNLVKPQSLMWNSINPVESTSFLGNPHC